MPPPVSRPPRNSLLSFMSGLCLSITYGSRLLDSAPIPFLAPAEKKKSASQSKRNPPATKSSSSLSAPLRLFVTDYLSRLARQMHPLDRWDRTSSSMVNGLVFFKFSSKYRRPTLFTHFLHPNPFLLISSTCSMADGFPSTSPPLSSSPKSDSVTLARPLTCF